MSNHKGARAVCVYILGAPAYVSQVRFFSYISITPLFERMYAKTKYVSLTVRTADYFRCRKRQAFESCRYEILSE